MQSDIALPPASAVALWPAYAAAQCSHVWHCPVLPLQLRCRHFLALPKTSLYWMSPRFGATAAQVPVRSLLPLLLIAALQQRQLSARCHRQRWLTGCLQPRLSACLSTCLAAGGDSIPADGAGLGCRGWQRQHRRPLLRPAAAPHRRRQVPCHPAAAQASWGFGWLGAAWSFGWLGAAAPSHWQQLHSA
jgi:hypothetical protein